MCPFQNKIKYFEMRIVGLSFLSSSPLPMFPLCVCPRHPCITSWVVWATLCLGFLIHPMGVILPAYFTVY